MMETEAIWAGRFSRANMTKGYDNNCATLCFATFMGIHILFPTIVTYVADKSEISDETGVTTAQMAFTTNMAVDAWEARATYPPTVAENRTGAIVGSGGALAAGVQGTFAVDNTELLSGDGIYTIRLYVQKGGVWY